MYGNCLNFTVCNSGTAIQDPGETAYIGAVAGDSGISYRTAVNCSMFRIVVAAAIFRVIAPVEYSPGIAAGIATIGMDE